MRIRVGHEFTISCTQPTPTIALVGPHVQHAGGLVSERVETTPDVPIHGYYDLFGNLCRRFVAPAGRMTLTGDATVEDDGRPDDVALDAQEVPVAALPDDALGYLVGSRYCETDRMSQTAWDLFGNMTPGWARVQAIMDYAHNRIRFDYQQARSTRTAWEANEEGVGVCRDFAHLAIALTRAMNIPARYVNGYLGDIGVPPAGPMDFAAWTEVFLGGRWYTFDPRNNVARIGRVVVARGRDAADVPLLNSFGPHWLEGFRVWADEVPDDGAPMRMQA